MNLTMLNESKLLEKYWSEAVYILKRAQLRINSDKTPYELWKNKLANVEHIKVFGSKCYIKIYQDNLGKFDSRCDEGIILVHSVISAMYISYCKRLQKVIERKNVKFDESYLAKSNTKPNDNHEDQDDDEEMENTREEVEEVEERQDTKTPSRKVKRDHPTNQIIGNKEGGILTRRKLRDQQNHEDITLLSMIEPNNVAKARND